MPGVPGEVIDGGVVVAGGSAAGSAGEGRAERGLGLAGDEQPLGGEGTLPGGFRRAPDNGGTACRSRPWKSPTVSVSMGAGSSKAGLARLPGCGCDRLVLRRNLSAPTGSDPAESRRRPPAGEAYG
jgi:hypothetical protein